MQAPQAPESPESSESTDVAETVRRIFSALFDDRDFETARQYWTERSVDFFLAAGVTARGPEQLEAFFRELFGAMPDFHVEIEHIVTSGDDVVVQWRSTGTFTGTPFQGIAANGRHIEQRGVDVIRLDADGKLDQNTVYYDGAEFARQLGLLPPRGSAMDRAMLWSFNARTKLRRAFGG